MASWFGHDSEEEKAHEQYHSVENPHEAKLSHEVVVGAAAYEAFKSYVGHVARSGKPETHGEAKSILMGMAAAFVDREFETKGLDYLDKKRVEEDAKRKVCEAYDTHSGHGKDANMK